MKIEHSPTNDIPTFPPINHLFQIKRKKKEKKN